MDSQQYEKLMKNLPLLYGSVDVGYILPYLVEKGVLESDDTGMITSIPTEKGRMKRLIKMLKCLPSDRRPFESFLDALRSSDLPDYIGYAKKIEETHTVSDPSVKSEVDPSHCEEKVTRILREKFANIKDQVTSLLEVKEVLVKGDAFTDKTWSNIQVANYVCEDAFVGVEQFEKRVGRKKYNHYFKHLERIDSSDKADACQAKPTEPTSKGITVDIQTLTSSELKEFLVREFKEKGLPTAPLDELVQEHISGQILFTLTEEDMKMVMPSSTFGHRRLLKLLIDKQNEQNEKMKKLNKDVRFENFRPFDKEVKATDRYVLGKFVDTKINSRGKKTSSLRNFHLPEFELESDVGEYVLKECAIFAAACINSRQNGTVYFGISPDDSGDRMKGEIVGVPFSLELQDLDNSISFMFFKNKEELIKSCVRNIKAVPVIGKQGVNSFVLELDVVPEKSLTEEEMVRVDATQMSCLLKKYKISDPIFIFSGSGKPRHIQPNESDWSAKVPSIVIEQRKCDEFKNTNRERPNLIPLQNNLTGGLDKLDDDLYIFLLLSPLCESQLQIENLELIKHLQPEVVFDFEPNSNDESLTNIYNSLEKKEVVMRVVTLNDFDDRQKEQKDIKAFQNELTECDFTNWVFCNGYGQMERMEAIDWNKKRSHAFQTAFTHYVERFQQDRVLIILCLFSHQYDVILDASEVIIRRFPEQWILLSETQANADAWQDTFKRRKKVDAKDLRDRCIVGLSWEQINNGITTWCGKKDIKECKIPDSSGCLVKVENKKISEWSDVEVLSALDPIDASDDEKNNEALIKQAEEEFYRGNQASWLNFFSDHACRRKIHQPLQKVVETALEGKSEDECRKIQETFLFHEPGSGGSTSARHILWSLRDKYRCCVIREINNPSQTADQLTEIILFKDKSPKPILVLLDNEDEDKLFQLRVNLERKARDYDDQLSDVFCVLLICSRMFDIPIPKRKRSMVALKQSLEEEDKIWFEQRYKDLTTRYPNPKSLISFNILKENFNKDYIKNTVKVFLDEIKDAKEEKILKIVSFINNYDLDFKFIHASCLDTILKSGPVFRSDHSGTRKTCWEANVSHSFKVLLNLNSKADTRNMKRIRLFTKHTAEHILNCLREKSGESVSDIMHSLLNDNLFGATGWEMKKFQSIISNIVKKRAFRDHRVCSPPILRKEKFSPLVLHIIEYENNDIAGQMMECLFELNLDPFTAQQVARFYIECKNYKKAEKYAEQAVALLPWNSYMWDTYAHVFKDQLYDLFQSKCQMKDGEFSGADLKDAIRLSQKCTELFRKEQSVSQKEALMNNVEINRAGYFGELRSILIMLSSIEKYICVQSKEIIHQFLVHDQYTNPRLDFLSKEETDYIKSLWNYYKDTVRKLGDEFLQTKVEIEANPLSSSRDESKKMLLKLHVSLNEYFGESSLSIPAYLHENENDECHYRSRLVFSKSCHSLYSALDHKHNNEFGVLKECFSLILENVKQRDSNVDDIKILLDIVTVLVTETDKNVDFNITFEELISWSRELYQRATKEDYRHLEPFLYFTLYNFPTEERLEFPSLASPQDLEKVLRTWKDHFNATKNLQRLAYRETTLFFLGNGHPPQDIVYQKDLEKLMDGTNNQKKWQSSEVSRQLRLMSGILSEKGDYIRYHYKSKQGNQNWIRVKGMYQIRNKAWLQKRVYFYLGFSFSGLKAYGITDTAPVTLDTRTKAVSIPRKPSGGPSKPKQSVMSLRELQRRERALTRSIEKKKRQHKPHADEKRDLERINSDIQEILGS